MENFTADLHKHVNSFPVIIQIILGLVFIAAMGFALYSLGRLFWNLLGGFNKKSQPARSELTEK